MPILKIIFGLILLCLLSPLSFDVGFPVTLQSLLIVLIALNFRKKYAVLIIGLYLILGFAGLPVFANGSSGIEKIWGNTGGFLFGFLIAGFVLAYWNEQNRKKTFGQILFYFILGHFIILLFGFLRLGFADVDLWQIFKKLLPGLFLKIFLGSGFQFAIIRFFNKFFLD